MTELEMRLGGRRGGKKRLGSRTGTTLDAMFRRSPLQPAFLWRASRSLTVLAYHGITDPDRFQDHLHELVRGWHPISLEHLVRSVGGGATLPRRAVLVTFDDGDRSVIEIALPMLRDRGIPGVAFVVAGLLDTEKPFWWAEAEALVAMGGEVPGSAGPTPTDVLRYLKQLPDQSRRSAIASLRRGIGGDVIRTPQLSSAELPMLESDGISVANHSLSHPFFSRCIDEVTAHEIARAHELLTLALGHHPIAFAYPDGDSTPVARKHLQRLDYRVGFLFDHRASRLPVRDPLAISRVRVDSNTSPDRFDLVMSGLHPILHRLRGGR